MQCAPAQSRQEEPYTRNDTTETPEPTPETPEPTAEIPDLVIDPVQLRKALELGNCKTLVTWKLESKA